MTTRTEVSKVRIVHADEQATGAFDGGRITETKPIGFPGEGGAIERVGPLFYWAWATADGPGKIGMHPHQGFEILSYVIDGEMRHRDSMGTDSRIGAGGVQAIQAGSGISHEEEMLGAHTAFFQIWLEPDLHAAVKRPAVYHEFDAEAFPADAHGGVTSRTILGSGSPLTLSADATMRHIRVGLDAGHTLTAEAGRQYAIVVMRGAGRLHEGDVEHLVTPRDFIVVGEATEAVFANDASDALELFAIELPAEVDYPLYDKRRR